MFAEGEQTIVTTFMLQYERERAKEYGWGR